MSYRKYRIRIVSTVALAAIVALSKAVALPPPPTANFSASPTNGVAPLTVDFTDLSSGAITNWFWEFGDSITTNIPLSASFTHIYEDPGTYSVELVVSGPAGSSGDTKTDYITVIPEPSTFLLVGVGLCICLAGNVGRLGRFR
jgi:PKD repeat protein